MHIWLLKAATVMRMLGAFVKYGYDEFRRGELGLRTRRLTALPGPRWPGY